MNTRHDVLRFDIVKSARVNDEFTVSELGRKHEALAMEMSKCKPECQTQGPQSFARIISGLYHRRILALIQNGKGESQATLLASVASFTALPLSIEISVL